MSFAPEPAKCDACGRPIDVPITAAFVTCLFCVAELTVARTTTGVSTAAMPGSRERVGHHARRRREPRRHPRSSSPQPASAAYQHEPESKLTPGNICIGLGLLVTLVGVITALMSRTDNPVAPPDYSIAVFLFLAGSALAGYGWLSRTGRI